MSIEHKISRSILRSTTAFELYKQDKMYYQALRIYKANKKIYKLLVQYSYSCEESILNDVHNYIFHLEDWFEQFQNFSSNSIQLEDVFVFDRLKNSIAFPSNFIHKLKTL
jgi:DNA polymerase III delta prime subunit